MQKWEYCVVGPVKNIAGQAQVKPMIGYYPTRLKFGVDKGERTYIYALEGDEDRNLVRLIAEMGQDGWELVGTGPVEPDGIVMHLLYFKRPTHK